MMSKKEEKRINKENILKRFKSNIFEAIMNEIGKYEHLFEYKNYSLREFIKAIEDISKTMENMIKDE